MAMEDLVVIHSFEQFEEEFGKLSSGEDIPQGIAKAMLDNPEWHRKVLERRKPDGAGASAAAGDAATSSSSSSGARRPCSRSRGSSSVRSRTNCRSNP